MLVSLVVHVTADADADLQAGSGRAAQALLLQWIAERDAALADSLHHSSALRPYTASALRSDHRRGRVRHLRANEPCWLRFTALQEGISQALLRLAEGLPDRTLELGGAAFTVQQVASDSAAHPWAGRSSYGDLAQGHFLTTGNPSRRVAFEFATPTAFHHTASPSSTSESGDSAEGEPEDGAHPVHQTQSPSPAFGGGDRGGVQMNVPLPLPELVFGSLLQRWNAFAPLALPDEVRRYAQQCLAVSRYQLHTRLLEFGPAKSVGFVGQCGYTALVWDPYWLRAIHLLAAYAFYSGLGVRTTVGMGQVRAE